MNELVTEFPFLTEIKSVSNEHTEVSKVAMEYMKKKYEKFSDYTLVDRKKTNQITMPGWALVKTEKSINVVGDVFINPKAFDSNTDISLLERLYHTTGNFVPIAEGANYGGSGGKSENYQHKLQKIKEYFDSENNFISKEEICNIEQRLNRKVPLGNVRLKILKDNNMKPFSDSLQLRYWILKEWIEEKKSWKDFIEENYFQDFVNGELEPLLFNSSSINDSLRLIIKRGYRIENKKTASDTIIDNIIDRLKNEI